jgi:hypothetical protein
MVDENVWIKNVISVIFGVGVDEHHLKLDTFSLAGAARSAARRKRHTVQLQLRVFFSFDDLSAAFPLIDGLAVGFLDLAGKPRTGSWQGNGRAHISACFAAGICRRPNTWWSHGLCHGLPLVPIPLEFGRVAL